MNRANLQYIAESGSINGSLMLDIEIAMDKYQSDTLTQYNEALRELVEAVDSNWFDMVWELVDVSALKKASNKAKQLLNNE